ncbi:ABC transporter substrate-binding protein [Palleronia sp. LCG004]|uniref:ABC transporter substrate-binding protein n=1 Tax=Palleronia sp. LCG004 TaxID=3079304 RepID=UPI002941F937|nr:ABC transporter substrate-binding protein [Palleronia sp. LCG004]WOI56202.1 ABC transporter substrate-binding protein [Palleronia sp. LCG004]
MKFPLIALTLAWPAALLAQPQPSDWEAVLAEADGQTVYWNAWGGSTATNDYIAWIGDRVAEYGVTLEHVKLADTADAVTRVLSEREAGQDDGGAIDLIWINGENFIAMKEAGLLFGPFSTELPNYAFVSDDPAITTDFGMPVDGMESPWAKAQFVFMYDSADTDAPADMQALLDWTAENPGRFTYPQPPDFLGTTFLKQVLVSQAEDPTVLSDPMEEADFDTVTAPLWEYLDALRPNLWRGGEAYPTSGPAQFQLLTDEEIDIAPSLSPSEASTAIANLQLPESVRTFVPEGGTIGNVSFLAIPYNSSAKAGAMVVANEILSPEAQLRGQDPEVLGYGTVLDMGALDPEMRQAFEDLDQGIATLSPAELGEALPEPHASWASAIEAEWIERYGAQ